ncbi:Protein atonal 7 [Cichlidogyrus casuarinus]|uniref:Protein atonal 7 n=1 Tax=Cichlidogyrus casuarinus TaxID=1844966 RepID=A0ABD2PPK7_9PLAT
MPVNGSGYRENHSIGRRRVDANMRERQRMRTINQAFEELRNVIPKQSGRKQKLSKYETLRMAYFHILDLLDELTISDWSN